MSMFGIKLEPDGQSAASGETAAKVDGRIAHCKQMAQDRRISEEKPWMVSLIFPGEWRDDIEEAAKAAGCSRSAWIRAAVAAKLNE